MSSASVQGMCLAAHKIKDEDSESNSKRSSKGKLKTTNLATSCNVVCSTFGGVGCDLDYRHPDFNEETVKTLEYMQSLLPSNITNSKRTSLFIAFRFNPFSLAEFNIFQCVCEHVIKNARLVVSTNNILGGGILGKHFGDDARGIVLFRD